MRKTSTQSPVTLKTSTFGSALTLRMRPESYRALVKYGAPITEMSPVDFMREGFFFTMGMAPNRVDILFDLTCLNFETAWTRRERARLAGVETSFLSRVDLIVNKEAVGRKQ